jgi:hypothetical protein
MYCSLLTSWAAAPIQPQGVMQVDFENGAAFTGLPGVTITLPRASNAITVDCNIARASRCSMRTEINNTPDYISHAAHRAEADTHLHKPTLYSEYEQTRYGFSLYLVDSWEVDNRESIDIIWQFKRTGTQPDVFVAIKGEDIVLRTVNGKQQTLIKNFPRGKWIDFRIDILWSSGEAGAINTDLRFPPAQAFMPVGSLKGRNMYDSRPKSGYLKWGLYKPAYQESRTHRPRIVFHDDIYVERLN